MVKRVVPDYPANRDDFEVISAQGRRPGGGRGGADQPRIDDLVFITSDAQLLRYPASLVRPQGRPAGGMAGIRLDRRRHVIWFGAVDPARESRRRGHGRRLLRPPCPAPRSAAKVSDFAEYPAKGRATGGVRAQRFLKGEDVLLLAWVGPGPARAVSAVGKPVPLPEELGRRDGSGVRLTHTVAAVGGAIGASTNPRRTLQVPQSPEIA